MDSVESDTGMMPMQPLLLIAAAVLARQETLVTLDRDFLALLPPRQLRLLSP